MEDSEVARVINPIPRVSVEPASASTMAAAAIRQFLDSLPRAGGSCSWTLSNIFAELCIMDIVFAIFCSTGNFSQL